MDKNNRIIVNIPYNTSFLELLRSRSFVPEETISIKVTILIIEIQSAKDGQFNSIFPRAFNRKINEKKYTGCKQSIRDLIHVPFEQLLL